MLRETCKEKQRKAAMRPKKLPECNLKRLFMKILKKELYKAGRMSKREPKMFTTKLLKKLVKLLELTLKAKLNKQNKTSNQVLKMQNNLYKKLLVLKNH